jgi:phosphoglycerate dehydrogenase-like enzyme
MVRVVRWGRSAYETDNDLRTERLDAEGLGCEWVHVPHPTPPELLRPADVLVVTSGVRVSEPVARGISGGLVVATTSGVDHIDLDACTRYGVRVVRLPEARRDAVVEHALASMIWLMRRFPALETFAHASVWARDQLPTLAPVGIRGATVAVVGMGVIGVRMAGVIESLGGRVLAVDPAGVPAPFASCSLEDALRMADAVTVHCALTVSSRGLFSADRIRQLGSTAVLVNTARGEVVDVRAAVDAVRDGLIRGFASDVFPVEPYPEMALSQLPGVVFSPHSAGYVHDLGRRVAAGVAQALHAWKHGLPLPYAVV